jgi:putative NIF3 family GTP cyclohydrolase 1 type 2
VYAAHTNLDSAPGGLNDALAECIGLEAVEALAPVSDSTMAAASAVAGLGRVGRLRQPTDLARLARRLKQQFAGSAVRRVGEPGLVVERVALCTGSGGGLVGRFLASGAQAYLTGDLRYHEARAIEAAGKGAVDIGHFASEHIVVDHLGRRLEEVLTARALSVEVEACRLEVDPFVVS